MFAHVPGRFCDARITCAKMAGGSKERAREQYVPARSALGGNI